MAVRRFRELLHTLKLRKADQKWFPRWVRRYAESVTAENGLLPVTDQLIIDFCRLLLNSGTPAWQRLQAVRAIGTYRSLVLETQHPDLVSIIQTARGYPSKPAAFRNA